MSTNRLGMVVACAAMLACAGPATAAELVLQTWGGVWETGARAVGDAFAKQNNVTVRYEQQQNTRMGLARVRAQASAPTVDILFSTLDTLAQATDENLLVPIDVAKAPGLAGLPKNAVHKASIDVLNILFGMAYRKDLAPFEPTKWEDLADPRLKGRVASPNAQFASGRWVVMSSLIAGGSEHNVEPGFEFLKKIKPNISSFVATDGESIKVLQSGEAAVLAFGLLSDFVKLLGPTSQIRFVIPEGKPVLTSTVGVGMANPRNAALALKFLEFIAQPEQQEAYCNPINATPVHPKAKPPEAISAFRPAPERLHAADFAAINKNLAAWDDRFKKEIQAR